MQLHDHVGSMLVIICFLVLNKRSAMHAQGDALAYIMPGACKPISKNPIAQARIAVAVSLCTCVAWNHGQAPSAATSCDKAAEVDGRDQNCQSRNSGFGRRTRGRVKLGKLDKTGCRVMFLKTFASTCFYLCGPCIWAN